LSEWRIPLSDLAYDAEEVAAATRVIESGWLSMGPEVQAFEQEFAAHTGARHAVAVSNGTAALHLSNLALGLGPGDEIIQPAINFVAAANMTVAVGATPVLADIVGLHEPTIDPAAVERLVTPRTKAVLVMHYGGYFCRMDQLRALCRRRGLALIEDACHAVGARYLSRPEQASSGGSPAGVLDDVACFSFFSNKNLATGEGGMITTDRDELAERLRLLRSHGMTTLTWDRHRGHASSYDVVAHGYNYRLDEIRAALGRVQLRKLDRNKGLRRSLVSLYRGRLADLPGWVVPFDDAQGDAAYHLMILVAPDERARLRVAQALRGAGIQTSLHYPCLSEFEAFGRFRTSPVERSLAFARRTITLPLFPHLSPSDVEEVCALIRESAARP